MRKLKTVALIGGLALAALAAPASAGQVQQVTTQVQLYDAVPADQPPPRAHRRLFAYYRFYGKVLAGKQKCARLRRLDLFEKRDGPDFKLGTGSSDSNGFWSITASSKDFATGTFYAKAPKAKRGARTVCKADRSPNLIITF